MSIIRVFVLTCILGASLVHATKVTKVGFTKTKSLKAAETSANAGNLVFWFMPSKESTANADVITATFGSDMFTAAANMACTVSQEGSTVAVSGTASEIKATSTKIAEVKLGAVKLADAKVAQVTCTDNLAANPAAGAVTIKVVTTTDTDDSTDNTDTSMVAANSVTWVSAEPGTKAPSQDPVQLVVKFKPNTEIAATGTVTLTADAYIYATAGTSVVTCTATTTSTSTAASVAVTVDTSVVGCATTYANCGGNGGQLVVTMKGTQLFTLGYEAAITCTGDFAVNGASGTVVKFDVQTSGDTTALTAQTGYTTADDIWGGVTRDGSLVKSETAANAGDLRFYFYPKTAHAVNDKITLTASTQIFTNDEAIVCTAVQDGNTIDVENSDSVTSGGTGKVLTLKLETALSAAKVVSVKCPKDELSNNAGTAATIGFTLRTDKDTTAVAAVPYHIVDAKSVTWGSATVDDLNATDTPTKLTVKFTPNTAIAETGTVTLTASQAIFTASNSTCTASTLSYVTGAAAAVEVASSTVTTTGTSAYKVITITFADGDSNQLATLGRELTIECTTFLAANAASGTAVTFIVATSGDTTATTAQTGYTTTSAPPPPPTPTPASNNTAAAIGTYSTATTAITFAGYTFVAGTEATNFANLVGCAYANHVADSTNSLTYDLCSATTVAGAPSFNYIEAASAVNTIAAASRRTGSTVSTALKLYHTLISQANFQTAVASAGDSSSDKTAILNEMKAIQGAAGLSFTDAQMTPSNIATATWTHSSAAVVVPSMMAMFSALLLVLMQ